MSEDRIKKDMIKYFSEVLGVNKVHVESNSTSSVELLILVENYQQISAAESELLTKMIEALKLEEKPTQIVDLNAVNLPSSNYQMYLVNNPKQMQHKISSSSLVTYSPQILNVKTQLKKDAWTEMQKVIYFFKS